MGFGRRAKKPGMAVEILTSPELLLPVLFIAVSLVGAAIWTGQAASDGDMRAVVLRFAIGVVAGFYYFAVYHYALGKRAERQAALHQELR